MRDSLKIDGQVTVLTSSRRVFIFTKLQSFLTRQEALTTSFSCSGAFPLLFFTNKSSISTRSGSTGGKDLNSKTAILVRIGTSMAEFLQHPSTVSFVSGWRKVCPCRRRSLISSQASHSSQSPFTSRTSKGGWVFFFLRLRAMGQWNLPPTWAVNTPAKFCAPCKFLFTHDCTCWPCQHMHAFTLAPAYSIYGFKYPSMNQETQRTHKNTNFSII